MRAVFLTFVLSLPGLALGQVTSQDQLLDRAIQEQQKGDLEAAIRDYRSVLAARVNLGAALAHSGQVDAAITEYQAALKLSPQLESVHLDLGLAFSR